MREIKFRAWDGERLKEVNSIGWVDGELDWIDTPKYNGPIDEDIKIMQYTGLKDKNGVDIYEGDILQPSNKTKDYYVVTWKDSGFQRKYTFIRKYDGEEWEETTHLPIYPSGHVVIGNIYENPELLEESAK